MEDISTSKVLGGYPAGMYLDWVVALHLQFSDLIVSVVEILIGPAVGRIIWLFCRRIVGFYVPEEFGRCSPLKCLCYSDMVLMGEKLDNRADSRNAFDGLPEGDRLVALLFP